MLAIRLPFLSTRETVCVSGCDDPTMTARGADAGLGVEVVAADAIADGCVRVLLDTITPLVEAELGLQAARVTRRMTPTLAPI